MWIKCYTHKHGVLSSDQIVRIHVRKHKRTGVKLNGFLELIVQITSELKFQ